MGALSSKKMILTALGTLLLSGAALASEHGKMEGQKETKAETEVEAGYGGAGKEGMAQKQQKNIIETARAAGNFNTLLKAVEAAGLTETLKQEGPFTLFAPTDEAFAKIPKDQLDALLKDKERLRTVLLSHVVAGQKVTEAQVRQFEEGQEVRTAADTSLSVEKKGKELSIEGAKIVRPGISASNGLIHVIDSVILEPGK